MATTLKGKFLGFKVLRAKADPTRMFGIIRVDDGDQTIEVLTEAGKAATYDLMEVGDDVELPIRMNARIDRGQAVLSIAEITQTK